jgi:hypothetical protein
MGFELCDLCPVTIETKFRVTLLQKYRARRFWKGFPSSQSDG